MLRIGPVYNSFITDIDLSKRGTFRRVLQLRKEIVECYSTKKQKLSFPEQRLCYIFVVSGGFSDAH